MHKVQQLYYTVQNIKISIFSTCFQTNLLNNWFAFMIKCSFLVFLVPSNGLSGWIWTTTTSGRRSYSTNAVHQINTVHYKKNTMQYCTLVQCTPNTNGLISSAKRTVSRLKYNHGETEFLLWWICIIMNELMASYFHCSRWTSKIPQCFYSPLVTTEACNRPL